MKVIYLGTPEFAVKPLERIINSDLHEVVAVVCQPDRPVGRKAIVTPPPVKVVAEKYDIPVLQFEKIRNGGAEELKKFNVLDKCDRNIVFEDLDATGYTVNREYFINCKAKEIRFDTCDYKNDKIKKCVVVFEYDDIINKL